MYEYKAEVLRVVDGDTLHLNVDLGCDVHTHLTVRLHGVNTPEVRGDTKEAGLAAKKYVLDWLDTHGRAGLWSNVTLYTFKDKREKYGRYLADIYANGRSLTQDLIESGHGKVWAS